ncbi:sucrose-phosphate synthase [Entomortierella parvispora]|uniref:sucrose-phosphate synthase n=1 Tax=Entomortierella parvispora TaxID=205924 RepID=A0A9P3LYT8_9FUNG|nr:sucrose-phosphate synthase [Entomortierella parvispora]
MAVEKSRRNTSVTKNGYKGSREVETQKWLLDHDGVDRSGLSANFENTKRHVDHGLSTLLSYENWEQSLQKRNWQVAAFYNDLRASHLPAREVIVNRLGLPRTVRHAPQHPKSSQLHIVLVNPQGNFNAAQTGIGDHADFGGQLIYNENLGKALGRLGVKVDILTRRWDNGRWGNQFAAPSDFYPGNPNVRILRFNAGPTDSRGNYSFLNKQEILKYLDEWVSNVIAFYKAEGVFPQVSAGHYADGGLASVLLQEEAGIRVGTFTMHSGGAQKMDAFLPRDIDLQERPLSQDASFAKFRFDQRIAAERLAIETAQHIVTSTGEEVRNQYGHFLYSDVIDLKTKKDDKLFHVIPPGIDNDIFSPDAISEVHAQTVSFIVASIEHDIPLERRGLPIVLVAGRLDAKKNQIATVRAFAETRELRQSANLMLMLTGGREAFDNPGAAFPSEQQAAEKTIAEKIKKVLDQGNMRGDCVIVPGLNNTQKEIAAAYNYIASPEIRGVFCHAALHEPFGLMPLEAAACGLPVVVTKNGGPKEIFQSVDGEEFCVFIDPQLPSDIAKGLLQALVPEKWVQLQKSALSRVADRFSWNTTAREYLRLMLNTIARSPTGGHPKADHVRAVCFAPYPLLAEFTRAPLYAKLEASRRSLGSWALLGAFDVDYTMYHPKTGAAESAALARLLDDHSMTLCYVTGAEVSQVLARVERGELPMPDAICSSVGTRMYLHLGNGMFVLDQELQDTFRQRGFDKELLLRVSQELAVKHGLSTFIQQPGNSGDEQAFKLSFHFLGNPSETGQGLEAVREAFAQRLSQLGIMCKVVVCEEVAYNRDLTTYQAKKFCLDLVPETKEFPIHQLLEKVPRVCVLTAGDSGNDIGLLCDVQVPGISVVVGNAHHDLISMVHARTAETKNPAQRVLKLATGVQRTVYFPEASNLGPASVAKGVELLLSSREFY